MKKLRIHIDTETERIRTYKAEDMISKFFIEIQSCSITENFHKLQ